MIFDPADLARGWLAVSHASAADKDRPQLHKTVVVEQFPTGVRLVATDSYMLLRSWVPLADDWTAAEPSLDEAPTATAIVEDPHGRGKGFLWFVLQQATKDDDDGDDVELRLDLGVQVIDDEARPTLAGLEPRWAVLEWPDHERVKLRLYEGEFPDWRRLVAAFAAESTETVALNPEIVGRLAKLAKVYPDAVLGWTFGGPERAARFDLIHAEPPVEGIVMPCRWDLDRNAPAAPPEPDEGES